MRLDELLRAELASEAVDHEAASAVVDEIIAKGSRRIRRRKFTAAVAVALSIAIAVSVSALLIGREPSSRFVQGGPGVSTPPSGLSAKQIQLAVKAAQHAASLPGLHPPGWPSNLLEAEAVLSDRSTATMTLMHDVTSGGFRKVIVIRLSGTFPWDISNPPGWRPPTPNANSIILVIDARTGEGLDSSLGNNVPQLNSLGSVVILYERL